MRVGLVLGAGGVVGASWLIGALDALESQTGIAPGDADVVVGTSAGSVIGSLAAAGIPPALLSAYASGEPLKDFEDVEQVLAEQLDAIERESPDRFRLQLALPPIGPGSWRMALATLRHPLRHSPTVVLGGWLPRGVLSTRPIRGLVDRLVGEAWPDSLRVVTCDYRTGRRVVFGSDIAPGARPSDAVAASCAIPGFYHPVKIGGRRYVDGGVCSVSNLDLLVREEVDVAICLNPSSSTARGPRTLSPFGQVAAAWRGAAHRRLEAETRKLRATGMEVVTIEPSAADLQVMGHNLMSRARRAEITEQAYRSVARSLRRRSLPDFDAKPTKHRAPLRRVA
jgi:NTE family protein